MRKMATTPAVAAIWILINDDEVADEVISTLAKKVAERIVEQHFGEDSAS